MSFHLLCKSFIILLVGLLLFCCCCCCCCLAFFIFTPIQFIAFWWYESQRNYIVHSLEDFHHIYSTENRSFVHLRANKICITQIPIALLFCIAFAIVSFLYTLSRSTFCMCWTMLNARRLKRVRALCTYSTLEFTIKNFIHNRYQNINFVVFHHMHRSNHEREYTTRPHSHSQKFACVWATVHGVRVRACTRRYKSCIYSYGCVGSSAFHAAYHASYIHRQLTTQPNSLLRW